MKTRNSFVSNSSSSSFIILGEKIEWWDLQNEQGLYRLWMRGSDLGDGEDVFELTKEMISLITKSGGLEWGSFYRSYKSFNPDNEGEVKASELPPIFRIYTFDRDYHSVSSMEQFKERYLDK